jgi:hypothetical protein
MESYSTSIGIQHFLIFTLNNSPRFSEITTRSHAEIA